MSKDPDKRTTGTLGSKITSVFSLASAALVSNIFLNAVLHLEKAAGKAFHTNSMACFCVCGLCEIEGKTL